MKNENITQERLPSETWEDVLAQHCMRLLQGKKNIFLCVTGKAGSGKSTFGRILRKNGLPNISPRSIAVIDDGVLSALRWGVFPRRIKHRSKERDELAPFFPYLKGKKLIVYVNAHPEKRLSTTDILLRLECSEKIRRERLIERESGGEKRYLSTVNEVDVDIKCSCHLILSLCNCLDRI